MCSSIFSGKNNKELTVPLVLLWPASESLIGWGDYIRHIFPPHSSWKGDRQTLTLQSGRGKYYTSIVWSILKYCLVNELFEKWRISPIPSPLVTWQMAGRHVISGGSLRRVHTRGTPHFKGGGVAWVALSRASPTQGNIVFCLFFLNYMTSRLCFWCYILLLTQLFFWC